MLQKKVKAKIKFQDFFNMMYDKHEMVTKNVTLVVTEKCNLDCSYCYEVHKNCSVMTKEIGRKTIDMLFESQMSESNYINSNNSEAIVLEFIGGEPLLEIALIDYLVDYFKHKAITLKHSWALNYMIGMTTNGILYENPAVQRFVKKNKDHLSMTITIDGNKELHDSCRKFPDGSGSYDIVEKAMKTHIKNFGIVGTKLTLAPSNIGFLVDAIKNLHKLGVVDIFSNCVFEEGWDLSHAKIFYEQLKKLADYMIDEKAMYEFSCSLFEEFLGSPMSNTENKNWCGGTGTMMAIDTKGSFYPCLRYVPFTLQSDREHLVIGDIYNGLEYTEEQQKRVTCLHCITRKTQSTDECYNCPIAQGCAWCSAYNYDQFGTPDKRATYICVMHKARVMANVYFWNKLYRLQGLSKRFKMNIPKEWALEIVNKKEYDMLIDISKSEEGIYRQIQLL